MDFLDRGFLFVCFFQGWSEGFLFCGNGSFFLNPGVSDLFSIKGQVVGTFGFVVSVTAAQLCHCSRKAATASVEVHGCGCAPIKLIYGNKRRVGCACSPRP